MKIQSINNQNNISHKAYFKPNTEFKKLWAVRPTDRNSHINSLRKFKIELPDHELEIIHSSRSLIHETIQDMYLIFNNTTKKALGVTINADSTKNHLEVVFDSLLEKNNKTQDFFKWSDDSFDYYQITSSNKK